MNGIYRNFAIKVVVGVILIFRSFFRHPMITSGFIRALCSVIEGFLCSFVRLVRFFGKGVLTGHGKRIINVVSYMFLVLFVRTSFFFRVFLIGKGHRPDASWVTLVMFTGVDGVGHRVVGRGRRLVSCSNDSGVPYSIAGGFPYSYG